MRVSRAQRIDIAATQRVGGDEIAASPAEARLTKANSKQVCGKAREASIAIRKGMNEYEPVMKPNRNFIGREGCVVDPVSDIVNHLADILLQSKIDYYIPHNWNHFQQLLVDCPFHLEAYLEW